MGHHHERQQNRQRQQEPATILAWQYADGILHAGNHDAKEGKRHGHGQGAEIEHGFPGQAIDACDLHLIIVGAFAHLDLGAFLFDGRRTILPENVRYDTQQGPKVGTPPDVLIIVLVCDP